MVPPPKKNKNLKQGSLFSFFNKKPATKTGPKATNAVAATPKGATTASKSSTNAPPPPQPDHPLVQVGNRIQVYLSEDDAWYTATVEKRRNSSSQQYYVRYVDDGQLEWLDLSTERFRTAPPAKQKKRRVIEEDDEEEDDEEMELLEDDMDASDEEGSVYKEGDAADPEDEDADEKWMVSDDDDDMEISGKRKTPTKRKAASLSKTTTPASSSKKTPAKKTSSSLSQFSAGKMTVTEHAVSSSSSQTSIGGSSNKTPNLMNRARPKQVTPDTASPPAFAAAKSKTKDGPLPFVANALNPAGSHVHNHLAFLQRPVDARGRAVDHPDYDPRTLTVRERDWLAITQRKMTDAVQQWWDLKSRYFDTVLLFKTGMYADYYIFKYSQ